MIYSTINLIPGKNCEYIRQISIKVKVGQTFSQLKFYSATPVPILASYFTIVKLSNKTIKCRLKIFLKVDPLGLYLIQHMFYYIVHTDTIFQSSFQTDLKFLDVPSWRCGP